MYGYLDINLEELGTPDALIAEVKVARFGDDSQEVRLGVDILGVYRTVNEADVTNVLGLGQPIDGCTVFSSTDTAHPDAGACVSLDGLDGCDGFAVPPVGWRSFNPTASTSLVQFELLGANDGDWIDDIRLE